MSASLIFAQFPHSRMKGGLSLDQDGSNEFSRLKDFPSSVAHLMSLWTSSLLPSATRRILRLVQWKGKPCATAGDITRAAPAGGEGKGTWAPRLGGLPKGDCSRLRSRTPTRMPHALNVGRTSFSTVRHTEAQCSLMNLDRLGPNILARISALGLFVLRGLLPCQMLRAGRLQAGRLCLNR